MSRGKEICKVLKDVRRRIAEENGINLDIPDCTFKGECRGSCPRCEAELRYLDAQLRTRHNAGRAVKIAGIAAGAMLLLSPVSLSANPIPDPDPVTKTTSATKPVAGILHGNVYYRYDENSKKKLNARTVTIKNMRTGKEVKSDMKGNFSIGASVGDILRISDFSFKTRRYAVKSLSNVSIELKYMDFVMGEMRVEKKYPDLKDAEVQFLHDSIEIKPININGDKAKIDDVWSSLYVCQLNPKGEIREKKYLDFDVNQAGNIMIHVDEVLDNIKPINGRYPSEVIIVILSDYYNNELKKRITIPESLIRTYRSGKVRK